MSLIFSRSCEYALQAVIYLARVEDGTPVHLRTISDSLNIPHHFLGKILQILTRDEIVLSTKGSNGGFRLGREASGISLLEIVHSVDGATSLDKCIMGFPECVEEKPCPLHDEWKISKEKIVKMLRDSTIDTLTGGLDSKLTETSGIN
jgi:Rrf2 family iron-sulfur cluster assembly transcriptional regulator